MTDTQNQPKTPDWLVTFSREAAVKKILILEGNVQIVASSGRLAWEGQKAVLCRCGASKNKPFCDGSHRKIGFEAE